MTRDRRGWHDHPLVQLTLVRYREFYREPEAIFWVFIFPVLLTAGLGIAFRSRGPERTPVALVSRGAVDASLSARLAAADGLKLCTLTDPAAAEALRTGEVALVVVPGEASVEYRYDPERPDARTARLLVDEAVQRTAGRAEPVSTRERTIREPGSRYVDFVVPGLLGMNLMGSGIWGLGFAIVDARRKHLLKRLTATPMSRPQFLASFVLSRLTFLVMEVALLLGFAVLVFGVPVRGSLLFLAGLCLLSALPLSRLSQAFPAAAKDYFCKSALRNCFRRSSSTPSHSSAIWHRGTA